MVLARTVLLYLFGLIVFLIAILFLPFLAVINLINKELLHSIVQVILTFISKIVLKILGIKIEILGKENLPNEPCLYVSNHRSIFDIFAIYQYLREQTFFVAKDSLKKLLIFKYWLKYVDTLFINRDDMKQSMEVILSSIKKIKEGKSCFIFPEGTRSDIKDHGMLTFKEGSFKIATKTGVPICPITMLNTRDCYEKDHKFRSSKIVIIVGDIIRLDDLAKEDIKHIGAYTQNIIKNNIYRHLNNN